MTPAEVNAEIARLRGWTFAHASADGARAHWRPASVAKGDPLTIDLAWFHSVRLVTDPEPPPFASSWALAGPLLEEMAAHKGGDDDNVTTIWNYDHEGECDPECDTTRWEVNAPGAESGALGDTLTECIARAWLAWKRGE